MRTVVLLALGIALLPGCTGGGRDDACPSYRPSANLVLSDDPDRTWLAANAFPRGDWPATVTGYRLGETTYFDTYHVDAEYWDDPQNGFTWRVGQYQQSGVIAPP
jgi:hypothetical protein